MSKPFARCTIAKPNQQRRRSLTGILTNMKTTDTQKEIAASFMALRSPDGECSFNFLIGYIGASIEEGDFDSPASAKLLHAFDLSCKTAEEWMARMEAAQ